MKLKMWIGNLDGSRQGLVIAASKARARTIVGTSRGDFEDHWILQSGVDTALEPEVLYTRVFAERTATMPWYRGRCPLIRKENKP